MTVGTTVPGSVLGTPGPIPDGPAGRPRIRRLLLPLVAALLVGAALVLRLGLVGGDAIGAADNGDGIRLYCVAQLAPDATDGVASGHGVTVTEFRTGGPACPREAPTTSAGLILQATVAVAPLLDRTPPAPDGSLRFSLEWLAAVYVTLLALGAGLAAAASTSGTRRRRRVAASVLAVVGPPLAPLLVVPWWSRFLVSTFSEAAGLVGAVWLAWGLLVVAVTRPTHRGARATGLALIAVGGLVAVTAKPGYLPLGVVVALACPLVAVGVGWRRRLPGVVAAVAVVVLAAAPVLSSMRAQEAAYDVVNAHNLAFTAVLPESGPAATAGLGLAPGAWRHAGEHFYFEGGRTVPRWTETVAARPDDLRADAYAWVIAHPRVLARMVHRGLVATLRPQIPYLAQETSGPGTTSGEIRREPVPEGSQTMGPMFVYLDGLSGRWVPPAVLAMAVLAALLTVVLPRRTRGSPDLRTAVGLARTAGLLALTALGVVVLAVLGDGYCELAKHVWLGSYVLVVAGTVLAAAAVIAGLRVARSRRPADGR
ncbi:hypothetical protein [Actinomycetospora cinnamomea]|uniref:Uncharacterized protein n=1 Tax=Actinomycetospora cinnamomea TaxID=663609 RepID=A0A2U1EYK1_9PSEU|nr:hypothetical protein [Actinomycetospora cinnamomea]PVZ04979.1 hypothetical protein C8D89_11685 [Actinomycetospora cinnamomea]